MFSVRETSILLGLYLSKFDRKGLNALGFTGPKEAFNTLGYAIGSKPASIKNYRDEFDPYFSNPRKGWRNRPLRDYCKEVLDEFYSLEFDEFTDLVRGFLLPDYEIEKFVQSITPSFQDHSETIAKRLITGKAAEEYFRTHYASISQFEGLKLVDTTLFACGFDFKLENDSTYYCIEVKGIYANSGTITLTEKEFTIAQQLRESYCLYVVSNFKQKPVPQLIVNPLVSHLKFTRYERLVAQITFSTFYA